MLSIETAAPLDGATRLREDIPVEVISFPRIPFKDGVKRLSLDLKLVRHVAAHRQHTGNISSEEANGATVGEVELRRGVVRVGLPWTELRVAGHNDALPQVGVVVVEEAELKS